MITREQARKELDEQFQFGITSSMVDLWQHYRNFGHGRWLSDFEIKSFNRFELYPYKSAYSYFHKNGENTTAKISKMVLSRYLYECSSGFVLDNYYKNHVW